MHPGPLDPLEHVVDNPSLRTRGSQSEPLRAPGAGPGAPVTPGWGIAPAGGRGALRSEGDAKKPSCASRRSCLVDGGWVLIKETDETAS